jgi:RNA-splicing ligase RtcB
MSFFSGKESDNLDVLNAYYMAFNFGYANRFYIMDQIIKTLEHISKKKIDARLLVDISHNSIIKETFENDDYWVHRHNSVRLPPLSELKTHPIFSKYGYPLIIPGTDRTSTYICVRGDHPEKMLNSMDHGFGQLVYNYLQSGNYILNNLKTRMFGYKGTDYIDNKILDDGFLDEQIYALEKKGIIKPVARLRPFATLKGPKPKIN